MGLMITSVVILGIGAGLFLVVTDQRVLDETIALASPNAIPHEVAPLPPLTSLPPLAPQAPVAASAPQEPAAEVPSEPAAPAAPRAARPHRRVHRANTSDGAFRRATRVGRERL